jgi:hypothetical protein
MSQTEQKIDVAGVARQALAERQAGEDLGRSSAAKLQEAIRRGRRYDV